MTLNENEKRADKKEKPLTKVVIRRLPPTMTQEQFLNQVSPVPDYNYIYYVKGDMSLGENSFARAYINFICPEDVYSFKERFDNYVFVDNKGHEYPAVVEFAPFQKIPKKRGKNKMDPKCHTVETDTYYLDFIASLNKPVGQEEKPEYTLQLNDKSEEKKDTTTPLLEFIKNKRAQRMKIREVRREERERRKKEFERKKEHNKYEGRYYDERSPAKANRLPPSKTKNESCNEKTKTDLVDDKGEKSTDKNTPAKNKEKKYEDRREKKEIKPRFPKKDYTEIRDYKRDDFTHREYRSKYYEDFKKEDNKTYPKKVKKYSERREERKMEAQKAEQKKLEQQQEKDTKETSAENVLGVEAASKCTTETDEKKPSHKEVPQEKEIDEEKGKDQDKSEGNSSKRIRNKDRPTIPLYRPGMLSKRKQNDDDVKSEDKKT